MKYFIGIILSLTLFSCQNEEIQKVHKELEIEKNFAVMPTEWFVAEEDFENEMVSLMNLSGQAQPGDHVEIRVVTGGYNFTLIAGGDIPIDPPPQTEIICVGSGAAFINCVYGWMQVNPDCCVTISPLPSGDPGFYAISSC